MSKKIRAYTDKFGIILMEMGDTFFAWEEPYESVENILIEIDQNDVIAYEKNGFEVVKATIIEEGL